MPRSRIVPVLEGKHVRRGPGSANTWNQAGLLAESWGVVVVFRAFQGGVLVVEVTLACIGRITRHCSPIVVLV